MQEQEEGAGPGVPEEGLDRILAEFFRRDRTSWASTAPPDPGSAAGPAHDGPWLLRRDPAELERRYTGFREIARGGMGQVLAAWDRELRREVALKILPGTFVGSPARLQRFVAEARICGGLQHPGIVPVYDVGVLPDGRPFLAMKLVRGRTLAEVLGGLPAAERCREVLPAFEAVAQAVAYAHSRGVVHCDLKPSNVMVGRFGEVLVMDWGLALATGADGAPESADRPSSGTAAGTAGYMAPEQARGEWDRIDARTDVFALGAMLCEILTGAPPYPPEEGDPLEQARRCDLAGAHARLDACGGEPALAELARRCLGAEPEDRPSSASEVAEAVGAFLALLAERARRAELRAAQARVRARWTVLWAATVVLALGLGGGAWLVLRGRAEQRRAEAERRIAEALQEAGELRARAEASGEDLELWARTVALIERAESLAQIEEVGEELDARVGRLAFSTRAQAERKRKDAVMRRRLLAARIPTDEEILGPDYWDRECARLDAAFAAAFGDYGADVELLAVGDAVVALRGDLDRDLADALDYWALNINKGDEAGLRRALHRHAIAQALHPGDEWRHELRLIAGEPPNQNATALIDLARNAEAARLAPETAELLATYLWQTGQLDAAVDICERARWYHPDDFTLCLRLALFLEGSHRPARAVEYYRIANALRPEMREVLHRMGVALTNAGDLEEAREVFQRLVETDPESGHWHGHLSHVLRLMGEKGRDPGLLERAFEVARHAVELDPEDARNHEWLALVNWRRGELEQAIEILQRAVELDPAWAGARNSLGEVYAEKGDRESAIASYRAAIEVDPKHAQALFNLGTLLFVEDPEEAEECLRQSVALRPANPETRANLGITLLVSGDQEAGRAELMRAREQFERKLEAEPDSRTWMNLAVVQDHLGDEDGAVESLEKAIALDPGNADPHTRLGRRCRAQGRLQEAAGHFRSAVEANAHYVPARRDLVDTLRDLGDVEGAIAHLETLCSQLPHDGVLRRALGDLQRRAGELEASIRSYRTAIEVGVEDASVHNGLGLAYHAIGEFARAVAAFDRASELEPDLVQPHGNRSLSQKALGDLEGAAASWARIVPLRPDDPWARHELFQSLVDAGRLDEAGAELDRMRGIAGEAPEADLARALQRCAWLLSRVERLEAIAAGRAEPATVEDWIGAAELAHRRCRYAEALATWRRLFAAHPELEADAPAHHRYNAACAAMLAAERSPETAEAQRSAWRQEALAWLQADLRFWRQELAAGGDRAGRARSFLGHWRQDADFTVLRRQAAAGKLPDGESARWQALGREVDELAGLRRP